MRSPPQSLYRSSFGRFSVRLSGRFYLRLYGRSYPRLPVDFIPGFPVDFIPGFTVDFIPAFRSILSRPPPYRPPVYRFFCIITHLFSNCNTKIKISAAVAGASDREYRRKRERDHILFCQRILYPRPPLPAVHHPCHTHPLAQHPPPPSNYCGGEMRQKKKPRREGGKALYAERKARKTENTPAANAAGVPFHTTTSGQEKIL